MVDKSSRVSFLLAASVALAVFGCLSGGADADRPPIAKALLATTYDAVAKPIPSTFLYMKANSTMTVGNKCCTGAGATSASCSNTCADSKGLITSAGAAKASDYYQA